MTRAEQLSVVAPLLLVAAVHAIGRLGWVAIIRTSGAVLAPGLDSLGWALPLLALAGLPFAVSDRYDPRAGAGPWITAEGRRHAIADLRRLPDEVRSRVEIVQQFGSAAVIKKPGAGTCL